MIFFGQNNGPQPNMQESLEFFRRKFLNYNMSWNLEQKPRRTKTNLGSNYNYYQSMATFQKNSVAVS